jgi:hypothetical protein
MLRNAMMVVKVPEEIEDAVEEAARELGVTPEGFVIDTLRARLAEVTQNLPCDPWESLLVGVGLPAGVSLSDEATTRESLYE